MKVDSDVKRAYSTNWRPAHWGGASFVVWIDGRWRGKERGDLKNISGNTKWERLRLTHDSVATGCGFFTDRTSRKMNRHLNSLIAAWIHAYMYSCPSHTQYSHTGRINGQAGWSNCFSPFFCGVVCLVLCVSGGPRYGNSAPFGLPQGL